MEQLGLLKPITKVNDHRYEVYDSRKFLGYIEIAKVRDAISIEYKYTVGLCYGGEWAAKANELEGILDTLAEGMVRTYRRRKGKHKEAWII